MFKSLVLMVAVAVAVSAEPAAYRITVIDPAGKPAVVLVEGKEVKPGVRYEVPAFVGEKELSFAVTWTDGGETVTRTGFFTVKAGYVTDLTFRVPREFLAHRPPAE